MSRHGNDSGAPRVWFITGASRGLGRAFAEAALAAGDRVFGTARDVAALGGLAAEHDGRLAARSLDVANRDDVFASFDRAIATFGRVDVVVNNAGQLLLGMIEEATEEQVRAHLDTNLFGALWVSQAAASYLREQGSGHIFQVTAAGAGGGSASVGLYCAGKAAFNALSEALAEEIEPFGIKVTILEPGAYDTGLGFLGVIVTEEHDVYAGLRGKLAEAWADSIAAGPEKAAQLVMEIVNMTQPPRRLILGGAAYDQVWQASQARLAEYARWERLSRKGD